MTATILPHCLKSKDTTTWKVPITSINEPKGIENDKPQKNPKSQGMEKESKLINMSENEKIELDAGNENIAHDIGTPEKEEKDKPPETAEEFIITILSIHDRLKTFASLEPCPEIDKLFGRLVGLAIMPVTMAFSEVIMTDPRIASILSSLHSICSDAEYALEAYWAMKICHSSSSPSSSERTESQKQQKALETLHSFPYYQNYVALTHMELHALQGVLSAPSTSPNTSINTTAVSTRTGNSENPLHIAFIGSGPLPLSSLLLLEQTQPQPQPQAPSNLQLQLQLQIAHILNIDLSPHATLLSTTLCNTLPPSLTSDMTFACESATDLTRDLRAFDIVYLAALVGRTQGEKEDVLKSVVGRMRRGALVVVRTAAGLRRLLYGDVELMGVGVGGVGGVLRVEVQVWPWGGVVNGVGIGRVL